MADTPSAFQIFQLGALIAKKIGDRRQSPVLTGQLQQLLTQKKHPGNKIIEELLALLSRPTIINALCLGVPGVCPWEEMDVVTCGFEHPGLQAVHFPEDETPSQTPVWLCEFSDPVQHHEAHELCASRLKWDVDIGDRLKQFREHNLVPGTMITRNTLAWLLRHQSHMLFDNSVFHNGAGPVYVNLRDRGRSPGYPVYVERTRIRFNLSFAGDCVPHGLLLIRSPHVPGF